MTAAQANQHFLGIEEDIGIGIGDAEHRFLFDYIGFLIEHNLADINYSDCLIDWTDRLMLPHFVAPLTTRGRRLVSAFHAMEAEMIKAGILGDQGPIHVAQEGFFKMEELSYFSRLPLIHEFQVCLADLKKKQK